MRSGALLAVGALHGVLLAALWPGQQPPSPAARREVSVTLLPAPAMPAAPAPVLMAARPQLSLPALPTIAPPAFDVQAVEVRPSPPAEPVVIVAAAVIPMAAPAPPRTEPAAEPSTQPARRAACAPAPHPLALRERGIEGVVRLRVWVDELGHAGQVLLAGSSGWRLFDDAAMAQARRCPFQPALRGSQPVGSWVEFPVRFALEISNG